MNSEAEQLVLDRLKSIENRLDDHMAAHLRLMSSFENIHRRLDEIITEIVERLKHLPKGPYAP